MAVAKGTDEGSRAFPDRHTACQKDTARGGQGMAHPLPAPPAHTGDTLTAGQRGAQRMAPPVPAPHATSIVALFPHMGAQWMAPLVLIPSLPSRCIPTVARKVRHHAQQYIPHCQSRGAKPRTPHSAHMLHIFTTTKHYAPHWSRQPPTLPRPRCPLLFAFYLGSCCSHLPPKCNLHYVPFLSAPSAPLPTSIVHGNVHSRNHPCLFILYPPLPCARRLSALLPHSAHYATCIVTRLVSCTTRLPPGPAYTPLLYRPTHLSASFLDGSTPLSAMSPIHTA